jgi:LysR family transcriptional regulator of abg operon
MNPNLLKQLAVVVKQGSISRAAEQLYVTQPTLTRAIQQLELRVGAPVLKRTRYGVMPTEVGARLAQIGERVLADADQGDEIIRQFHSGYQSEFAIGIDPLWEFATVSEFAESLLREPKHVFHLRTGSASVQMRLLLEGELDFMLAPAHLTVPQGELQREILFRDRAGVLAGAKSNLIGRAEPIQLQELEHQHWITAGARAGFLDAQGDTIAPQAAKMAFTGSIFTVLHLLKTTHYLVRMPARLALMTGQLSEQQLLQVAIEPGARRDVALWYRAADMERPEFTRVHQILRDSVLSLDKSAPSFGLII